MSNKWPNGKVSYKPLRYDARERIIIKSAMKKITDLTNNCITFEESSRKQGITFIRGSGCYSYVGMFRAGQILSLGNGCVREYIVMHELLHALGF